MKANSATATWRASKAQNAVDVMMTRTEESSLEPEVDSSFPLTHHDPRDLGLICLIKKRKIRFRILLDLRIQSSIFLKKRTLRVRFFKKTEGCERV